MLTDRSFVLTVPEDPRSLPTFRAELVRRLPDARIDDELLLVASLLVRQAQSWRGATGPVRLRSTMLGQVVSFEVIRDVELDGDTGPACMDGFHGMLETLADRADRFTVSTFPGSVSLAAQKMVVPLLQDLEIDLRVAA